MTNEPGQHRVQTTIDFTTPGLPLGDYPGYSVNSPGFDFTAWLFNCSTPQAGCANTNISNVQGAAFFVFTANNFLNSAGQISAYTINDIAIDYVQAPPSMTPYGPFYVNIAAQDYLTSAGQYITTPLQCTSSIGTITTLDVHNLVVAVQQSDVTEQTILIHCSQPIYHIYFAQEEGVNTSGTSGFILSPYILMKSISFTLYPPSTGPSLQLVATALDANENDAQAPVSSSITSGSTISLLLGGLTSLQLQDNSGNPLTATYQLSGTPTFNSSAPPVDVVNGLYLDRLALLFDPGVSTDDQELMPVHLGTQTLTITPTNTQYSPVTLNLNIISPSTLSSKDTEYDQLIINYAHTRGIPPQYIKGEIRQESNFVATAFRYEPSNVDRVSFGYTSKNLGEKAFSKYALTDQRNPTSVPNSELHPRSKYGIFINNVAVFIPDNYELKYNNGNSLKSSQIMAVNNSGLSASFPAQNWDTSYVTIPQVEFLDPGGYYAKPLKSLSVYGFTAQTILASSYGLMQPLYSTVANRVYANYLSPTGMGLDPLMLFDPDTNLNYATKYLLFVFKKANGGSSEPGSFISFQDFVTAWRNGFQMYNAGPGSNTSKYQTNSDNPKIYNASVWLYSKNYFPTSNPIFGN